MIQIRKIKINIRPVLHDLFFTYILRPRRIWELRGRWGQVALYVCILTLALFQTERTLQKASPPFFVAGTLDIREQERSAAFRWLKGHSPSDATVIADQYDGNWIVAFANRRVVASSKAYPSEAKEVARRYRDIGKFFFALNEKAAMDIVDRYKVDYVFLGDSFTFLNCEYADACHWNAGGELTPEGKRQTMLGKFYGRENFEHFEIVWQSPHFLIYRVLNAQTDRNRCRLTQAEKKQVLEIARLGVRSLFDASIIPPRSSLLPQQCAVDASILVDGETRGSIIILNKPLGQATFESAGDSAKDARFVVIAKEEIPKVRFEVSVFSNEELVPMSLKSFINTNIDAARVYVLVDGNQRGFYLPVAFNALTLGNNTDFLASLCKKAGSQLDCYHHPGTQLFSAPVQAFVEHVSGEPTDVFATVAVGQDGNHFSKELVRERAIMARDWMLSLRMPSGPFRAAIDPAQPEEAVDVLREEVLDPGETFSLLELANVVPHAETVRVGRQNSNRFDKQIFSGQETKTAYLIYAGLSDIALWEITKEPVFRDRALAYAKILHDLHFGSSTIASFQVVNGVGRAAGSEYDEFMSKTALYFLARTLKIHDDADIRQSVLSYAEEAKKRFQADRILKSDSLSLAEQAWLVSAFRQIAEITQDRSDSDFALEVASWLMEFQFHDKSLHRGGAFQNTPTDDYFYTRGSGKDAEALVDAVRVAREFKYHNEKFYMQAFQDVMRWLITLQYTQETAYFVPRKNQGAVLGAFRASLQDPRAPIDAAGHFITAAAEYLKSE